MRIAVYNAHWATLGGGEQLAAGIATALAHEHEVDLLVAEPFDAERASERLGGDLTGLTQRQIVPRSVAMLEASADYDLLVNSSFASQFPSRARRSVYYVHFPVPAEPRSWHRRLVQGTAGPLVGRGRGWVEWPGTYYLIEFPGLGRWTDGDMVLHYFAPPGVEMHAGITLQARFWPSGRSPKVTVTVDGGVVFDDTVGRKKVPVRTRVRGRGAAEPIEVRVTSDTFIPRVDMGIADDRTLGVVVSRAFIGVPTPHVPSRLIPEWLKIDRFHPDFLRSYDDILVNSEYTGEWVRRLWDRSSVVLSPPVPMRATGTKDRIVLSVGRFFPNESGHSKKQLELVRAFRRLVEHHGVRDWELHLVGGCSDDERSYVDTIRRESLGLPVRLHINARGEDLESLYARATLFWHGAGLGERQEINPDRFEHFGISVVEAMSAGAVPMVFSRGGPAAIVEHGVSGMHFSSIDELATQTASLVQDPDLLATIAARATSSAQEYDAEHFAHRARAFVERVTAEIVA